MIKAVFFDFDGVLVNSMPFHVKAWRTVFDDYDIEIKPDEILLTEGSRSIDLAQEIFRQYGYELAQDDLVDFVKRKQQVYQQITRADLDSGAEDFLSYLKQNRLRLGLVTGTTRSNVRKVLPSGIIGQFHVMVTGDDVENGKPDPEPYSKAAQSLRVPPESCFVIENAPLGIQSAKNAGMKVAALTTTLTLEQLVGADFYASNLRDLHSKWQNLFG